MPTSEFMSQALTTDNGLYLYCGHGGGEKAYTRLQVEGLMNIREDGIRGCRATVVLMGCSSGKLQSVNTPKSTSSSSSSYYTMHYERARGYSIKLPARRCTLCRRELMGCH